MRILRISSRFHPPYLWFREQSKRSLIKKYHAVGGMQYQVFLLTKALSDLGVQQDVITIKPPWNRSFEHWGNVNVYRYGLPVPTPRQFYEIPALLQAMKLVRQKFDLVHVHSAEDIAAIPIGLAAAKYADIPFVLTIHNSWNFTFKRTKKYQLFREIIGKHIEIIGIKNATAICVLSNRIANLLFQNFKIEQRKLFVIPDGIDTKVFDSKHSEQSIEDFIKRYNIPSANKYITFLGRLTIQKGVICLLNAIALLKNQSKDFKVIICGDGPERNYLEKQTQQLGLEKRVIFIGYIYHDDVPLLFNISDIVVVPSIFEEFGSVLLEAMAMRKSIIATRVGGIQETIRHMENGLLVQPMNPQELADMILKLLNNQVLARNLGEHAYNDVQKYRIDEIAKKIINVYYICKNKSKNTHLN